MKCEEMGELLPDYLQGSLKAEQDELVEQHIAECADCREDVAIWKKLSLLPVEQPSAESRERFEAMLHAYQTGRSDKAAAELGREKRGGVWNWLRSPVGTVAWSAALLVIGVFAGNSLGNRPTHSIADQGEIAAMHSELTNMRQLVVLSMLQQQSASERLQGVSYSQREGQLDPQVVAALVHTLRYDNSVDVRLAALDALSMARRAAASAQRRCGSAAGAAIAAGAGGVDRPDAGMARSGLSEAAAQFCGIAEFESDGEAAGRLGGQQIELRRERCAGRENAWG